MEAANRGASLAGGKSLGFNIHLPHEQAVNRYVPRDLTFTFHYFFMRKFWFVYLAKALVIFPGGFGTLDEFCEILTWAQLGLHHKPCGVLNVNGYFNHFSRLLDHAVGEQFLRPLHRAMVICDDDPENLLRRMMQYEAPLTGKWIDRSET